MQKELHKLNYGNIGKTCCESCFMEADLYRIKVNRQKSVRLCKGCLKELLKKTEKFLMELE